MIVPNPFGMKKPQSTTWNMVDTTSRAPENQMCLMRKLLKESYTLCYPSLPFDQRNGLEEANYVNVDIHLLKVGRAPFNVWKAASKGDQAG
jgi:hypothetical protein